MAPDATVPTVPHRFEGTARAADLLDAEQEGCSDLSATPPEEPLFCGGGIYFYDKVNGAYYKENGCQFPGVKDCECGTGHAADNSSRPDCWGRRYCCSGANSYGAMTIEPRTQLCND